MRGALRHTQRVLPLFRRLARIRAVNGLPPGATVTAPVLIAALGQGLRAGPIVRLVRAATGLLALERGPFTLVPRTTLLRVVHPFGCLASDASLALRTWRRGIGVLLRGA